MVEHVEPVRIGPELLVVVRAGAAADVVAALLPALAAVLRDPGSAFASGEFDGRVDDVRALGGDGQADLAHVLGRQSVLELAPGRSAVDRLVDAGLRSRVHQRGHRAVALVRRGVEHVGVARIEQDVGDPGPGSGGQHGLPGHAVVGRAEEPTLAALGPERALGCDEDHSAPARVDQDARDVLGLLEAELLEALAAVAAPVHAVAVPDVPTTDVLTRTDPEDVGVAGVERQAADRVRPLPVEDRLPGRAGVGRLPHTARARRDVPGVRSLRIDDDVRDATRHQCGTDAAELQTAEELGVEARLFSFVIGRCRGVLRRGRRGADGEGRDEQD